MSLTNMALSIGAKVIGHDDIKVGAELHDGIRGTNEKGTVIIPPSTHGDGRTGPIVNDSRGNVVTDPDYMPEEKEPESDQPPAKSRRRKKQQQQETPAQQKQEAVKVVAHMDGFGTVKTTYAAFDPGVGCLRIELNDMSWEPPTAERDDSGAFRGLFSFEEQPGHRYMNLGLEFVHGGRRSILLIEAPEQR